LEVDLEEELKTIEMRQL